MPQPTALLLLAQCLKQEHYCLLLSASSNCTTACRAVPQPTALLLVAQCLNQPHYYL